MTDQKTCKVNNLEIYCMGVVYFNQHLGGAHSKCWLKYTFSHFLHKNVRKEGNARKLSKFVLKVCTQTLVDINIFLFQLLSQKCEKSIFWQEIGVCSSQTLVQKYNTCVFFSGIFHTLPHTSALGFAHSCTPEEGGVTKFAWCNLGLLGRQRCIHRFPYFSFLAKILFSLIHQIWQLFFFLVLLRRTSFLGTF